MSWTKRTQNRCKDCGDTWYPKGRNLSRQCPNCGSRNVTYAGCGCGCLAIIIIGLGVMSVISQFSSPRSTTATSQPTATPLPARPNAVIPSSTPTVAQPAVSSAPRFATVAEAQREALRRYPQLGVAGSTFNSFFVARHKQYQQERPDYFRDPSWPVTLAEETAKALNPK